MTTKKILGSFILASALLGASAAGVLASSASMTVVGKANPPMGNMAWLRIGTGDAEAIDIVVTGGDASGLLRSCEFRGLFSDSVSHPACLFRP